jgi:hypothetical protein
MTSNNRPSNNTLPSSLLPSEDTIQAQAVKIFRLKYPRLLKRLFHIPNGGKRSKREAAKFKILGVLPGVCDLFLAVPVRGKGGLFIEVKDHKGVLSKEQKDFIADLSGDYLITVARSSTEILDAIDRYLKGDFLT